MDRYTLIRRLGEGSTKEVFLARDEMLHREVALCKFKPHALSGGYLERIRREARTLAGLGHPNIISLFDLLEDDGCILVTEFVAGGSLKSRIASDWKNIPDLNDALRIAAEVCDALAETHARGIFHRDVKPSNVLLTEAGTAKLGDYGLAKPRRDESTSEDGLIVGSVPYMSPEQAKGLRPDSPSDMYSLGVMLFEMVAGRRPFDGEDASVLVHHLNSTPPPPTRFVPECPANLETLILRLLDKDPEMRPSATEAAEELRRIREEQPAGSTAAAKDEPADAPGLPAAPDTGMPTWPYSPIAVNQRVRRIALPGLIILSALAVMGLLVFWNSQNSPVPIRYACAIDKKMTYDIVNGPATEDSVLSLLRAANPELFEHLGGIISAYVDGVDHRGITYSWGVPGLGKSDVARELAGSFAGDSCLIRLTTLFGVGSGKLGFSVVDKPDLATLSTSVTFNTLPAVADSREFSLDSLFTASGCRIDGATVPLIIVDGIDEVHSETSSLILESLDNFIMESNPPAQRFGHVIVFGRSEGLAPWFQSPKRLGAAISPFLSVFQMKGPLYRATGDLVVLANDRFEYILGMDTWSRMKQGRTAERMIQEYIDYVRRHRFLSYSIRSLSVSRMITERARVNPSDTELELKSFLFDQLLLRAAATHGRPEPGDDRYLRILEAIAAKYASDGSIDDGGFFSVSVNDTVPVERDGESPDEVKVRTVLDHSGIAISRPATHATARYRFEPAWVLAHLIELHNRRVIPRHQARACY